MSIKFSEEELQNLLNKNPNLKVAASFGKSESSKISLDNKKSKTIKIKLDSEKPSDEAKETTKRKSLDVRKINSDNLEAKYIYSYSEDHFSFIIFGARLLSINDLFALLQNRPYEVFIYKKKWYSIVQKILQDAKADSLKNNKIFPYFNGKVELTLIRQAPRLVDSDSITTMYKFIIDSIKLKSMKKLNKEEQERHIGLIAEDDPSVVAKINHHNNKGSFAIGLKIEPLKSQTSNIKLEDILI